MVGCLLRVLEPRDADAIKPTQGSGGRNTARRYGSTARPIRVGVVVTTNLSIDMGPHGRNRRQETFICRMRASVMQIMPQAIRCALGRHEPNRERVRWDGHHYIGHCVSCGANIYRVEHKRWRVVGS